LRSIDRRDRCESLPKPLYFDASKYSASVRYAKPLAPGPLEQRVVDVGDVLHVLDPHAVGLEKPDEDVEHREREGVAHVP